MDAAIERRADALGLKLQRSATNWILRATPNAVTELPAVRFATLAEARKFLDWYEQEEGAPDC